MLVKEINILGLLKSQNSEDVIFAVGGEGLVNWSDIYTSVLKRRGRASQITVKRRLDELAQLDLITKRRREKEREEYTYHPTKQLESLAALLKEIEELEAFDARAISEKVTIYTSREAVVTSFSELVTRALPGDIVFGQCKMCAHYPKRFYDVIEGAVSNGVMFQFVVSPHKDGLETAKKFYQISRSNIQLVLSVLQETRLLGIVDKEVLLVVSSPTTYTGIHITDQSAVRTLYTAFQSIWETDQIVKPEELRV